MIVQPKFHGKLFFDFKHFHESNFLAFIFFIQFDENDPKTLFFNSFDYEKLMTLFENRIYSFFNIN